MSDDDAPAPMISGPLLDDSAIAPAQSTLGESLEATASAGWRNATEVWRNPAAFNADYAPASDQSDINAATASLGLEGPTYDAGAAQAASGIPMMRITPAPISAADANAANKAAGGTLTPFTHDTNRAAFNGMLADNLANNKDADVIARSAGGIIASPARFATGMLVSLADPRNIAAMMIPGLPEAGIADALGGGMAARAATRGGLGAAQNAAIGVGLAPLQAAQAGTDHSDFSWGETLRNAAYMAAFGALHGGVAGAFSHGELPSETVHDAMKAGLASVMRDDPSGADVQAIVDQGWVAAANAREMARVQAIPLFREAEALRSEAAAIPDTSLQPPTLDPVAQARVDAAQEELTRPGASPSAARTAELHAEIQSATEGGTWPVLSDLEQARNESQRQGLLVAADRAEQNARDLQARATQSATDTANRALNPADPALAVTQKASADAIAAAPKMEGIDIAKDTAEWTQRAADAKAEYDGLVAGGGLAEHPSVADAGKAEAERGKAAEAYAKTCAFGG